MSKQVTNLLIVEDVPSLAETYAAYLSDDTCRVTIAGTAAEAMANLEQMVPAVLILDVNLPDANGINILRQIRS